MTAEINTSVVVVTYRRPEGLARTLESVAAQTRQADEVIVCDDCSGDETPDVVEKFRDRIPNLRFFSHEKNLGLAGNLNFGIGRVSGDLVLNLHDGDKYHPELFEKCIDAMGQYPSAGLVFWDSPGMLSKNSEIDEFTTGCEFFEKHYLFKRRSCIWGTAMVRRSVYDRLMPFDLEYGAWADVDMWMRVCGIADIVHLREPLMELLVEGWFRKFDFQKPLRVQRMIFRNIYRMYRDEPERLAWALRGQLRVQRSRWFRHMFGRIYRFEPGLFLEGLRLAPDFFTIPKQSDHVSSGPD